MDDAEWNQFRLREERKSLLIEILLRESSQALNRLTSPPQRY